jgi:hypothetical protein
LSEEGQGLLEGHRHLPPRLSHLEGGLALGVGEPGLPSLLLQGRELEEVVQGARSVGEGNGPQEEREGILLLGLFSSLLGKDVGSAVLSPFHVAQVLEQAVVLQDVEKRPQALL